MGVFRLATKAGQAIPVVEVARDVGPRVVRPPSAQALDVQALAAVATGVGLPHVGEAATAIGPTIRHADGATEGRPLVVPLARAAGHGAPTEEALPEVLTAKGPRVPSAAVPFRTRGARGVPAPLVVGTPHVPTPVAAIVESGTGPVAVPSGETAVPPIPVARREGLQANAATGRKVLSPSAVDVVLEAEDATPREFATSPLVATRVAFDLLGGQPGTLSLEERVLDPIASATGCSTRSNRPRERPLDRQWGFRITLHDQTFTGALMDPNTLTVFFKRHGKRTVISNCRPPCLLHS